MMFSVNIGTNVDIIYTRTETIASEFSFRRSNHFPKRSHNIVRHRGRWLRKEEKTTVPNIKMVKMLEFPCRYDDNVL